MTDASTPTGSPSLPADWSQFIPDLVSSAIIGALIGALLYIWQKSSERRQAETFALASWSVARSRVMIAVRDDIAESWLLDHTVTDPFRELSAVVDALPIAQWRVAAPGAEELKLVNDFATRMPLLRVSARDVLSAVDVELMSAMPGFPFVADRDMLRDETLRKLRDGAESVGFASSLSQFFGLMSKKEADAFNATTSAAAAKQPPANAFASYQQIYTDVRDTYLRLRSLMHPEGSMRRSVKTSTEDVPD